MSDFLTREMARKSTTLRFTRVKKQCPLKILRALMRIQTTGSSVGKRQQGMLVETIAHQRKNLMKPNRATFQTQAKRARILHFKSRLIYLRTGGYPWIHMGKWLMKFQPTLFAASWFTKD